MGGINYQCNPPTQSVFSFFLTKPLEAKKSSADDNVDEPFCTTDNSSELQTNIILEYFNRYLISVVYNYIYQNRLGAVLPTGVLPDVTYPCRILIFVFTEQTLIIRITLKKLSNYFTLRR